MVDQSIKKSLVKFHHGNGFIVTNDGVAFTCYHVIKVYLGSNDDEHVKIPCKIGDEDCFATVIDKWETIDFAVVQIFQKDVQSKEFTSIPIGFEPVHIDPTKKFNIPYYNYDDFENVPGENLNPFYDSPEVGFNYLKFKCNVDSGLSGSPVWDFQSKKVIGVVIEQDIKDIHDATRQRAGVIKTKIYSIAVSMSSIKEKILNSDKKIPGSLIKIIETIKKPKEELQEVFNKFGFSIFNDFLFESILQAPKVQPFRSDGPKIPDFEKGNWVYIPEKALEIYNIVQKGKVVILSGKPATGKSVIARFIGFESAKSNITFYIDFLTLNPIERQKFQDKLDNIIQNSEFNNLKLKDNSPLFIFENIHELTLMKIKFGITSFINSLKALSGRVKVLITTREDISERSNFSWIEEKNRIDLNQYPSINQDIVKGIISKINKSRSEHNLIPLKWKTKKDEVENLWLLGWFIRILLGSKSQAISLMDLKRNSYEFKKEIKKYYKRNFDFDSNKILAVMLIISILSKYEIYMEQEFILKYTLDEFKGLNAENTKDILNQLVKKNEILIKEVDSPDISIADYEYRIPHIRLAEIFLEYYDDHITDKKVQLLLNRYFLHGKNNNTLGDYFWNKNRFLDALKCYRLVDIESKIIKTFLNRYNINIGVKENHITSLALSKNELEKIPKELRNLLELEILDLSYNKIVRINNLDNLVKLKILDLSFNPIKQIQNLSMLSKLEILSLSGTNISRIENLENLSNLRFLDLKESQIFEIIGLENLVKLKILDLSENTFQRINGLDKLTTIEIIGLKADTFIRRKEEKPKAYYSVPTSEKSKAYYSVPTPETDEYDYTLKMLILGDGGVGKTSLTNRYCYNFFNPSERLTIGVDFHVKTIELNSKRIKLQLWDFGGEQRFRFLLPTYSKGSNGALLLYDITNFNTLVNLVEWVEIVKSQNSYIPMILIGAKLDLDEYRAVPRDEGILMAEKLNVEIFIETSSKTGQNVEKSFEAITESAINKQKDFSKKYPHYIY